MLVWLKFSQLSFSAFNFSRTLFIFFSFCLEPTLTGASYTGLSFFFRKNVFQKLRTENFCESNAVFYHLKSSNSNILFLNSLFLLHLNLIKKLKYCCSISGKRNSIIRTLFRSSGSYGQRISRHVGRISQTVSQHQVHLGKSGKGTS